MTTLRAFQDLGSIRDRLVPRFDQPVMNGQEKSLTPGQSWWEEVTPERAVALLETRRPNRPISKRVVASYVEEMLNDRWRKTAAPIQVDTEGQMFDGQHRLAAIEKSGCTQFLMFVVMPYEEAMDAIDLGKKRTFKDYLTVRGVEHAGAVGNAVRNYILLRRYEESDTSTTDLPIPVLWAAYQDVDADIWRRAAKVAGLGEIRRLQMFVSLSACYAAFCVDGDQVEADQFVERVNLGTELHAGDPVHTLRRAMSIIATDKFKHTAMRGKLMMVVKAWNAWVRGNELRHLKVTGVSFPRINKAI